MPIHNVLVVVFVRLFTISVASDLFDSRDDLASRISTNPETASLRSCDSDCFSDLDLSNADGELVLLQVKAEKHRTKAPEARLESQPKIAEVLPSDEHSPHQRDALAMQQPNQEIRADASDVAIGGVLTGRDLSTFVQHGRLAILFIGLVILLLGFWHARAAGRGPMAVRQALPEAAALMQAFSSKGKTFRSRSSPATTDLFEDKLVATSAPWREGQKRPSAGEEKVAQLLAFVKEAAAQTQVAPVETPIPPNS